jgi:hypothetical protein
MAMKLNEDTEINVPLKTLVIIIFALLSASWYVFTTYEKINVLESDLKLLSAHFENYKTQPSRSAHDLQILELKLEYLTHRVTVTEGKK